jgi:hypothetical protein
VEQAVLNCGPWGKPQSRTISRRIQDTGQKTAPFGGFQVRFWKLDTYLWRMELQQCPQCRGHIPDSTGQATIGSGSMPRCLDVKANATTTCVEAGSSIRGSHFRQIHASWGTLQDDLGCFQRIIRNSQRSSKIISAAGWEYSQAGVGAVRSICQRLERTVTAHRQEHSLISQDGLSSGQLEIFGTPGFLYLY